jgi:hypothetical protein
MGSLELLRLGEEDVLFYDGVILAKNQLLRHILGVLPGHVEESSASLTQELDEDALDLSLCHLGRVSRSVAAPRPLQQHRRK